MDKWIYHFDDVYEVKILPPQTDGATDFNDLFTQFSEGLIERIRRKMVFGDAILLMEAEKHQVEKIVTWNKKHFEGRTNIEILTPKELVGKL